MAFMFTRLSALLWNSIGAHKAVVATAIAALAAVLAGLGPFPPEPSSRQWSIGDQPPGDSASIEQMERWLAQGIDTSALMRENVPGYVKGLKDKDPVVRRRAATALWHIGPEADEAIPALLQAVRDPDLEIAIKAVETLERTERRYPEILQALLNSVQDSRPQVRAAAVEAFTDIFHGRKPVQFSPQLQENGTKPIADQESQGHQQPEGALGRFSPKFEEFVRSAVVPVLTRALRDSDAHVRAQAAAALAETGRLAKPAMNDLIYLLQTDSDVSARLNATFALGRIGRDAVPALADRLRKEKVELIRWTTVLALSEIDGKPRK